MTTRVLHYSIGPVQSFVSQARRTRDLWAGSFVLSWLAGHAIAEVRRQGGQIIFPRVVADGAVVDPLLAAIEGVPLSADPNPHIGSLPNRFKATVAADFDALALTASVQRAWKRLADAVWEQFVEPVMQHGHDTRAIWDRQVDNFWESTWVLGESPQAEAVGNDASWLDARKNWRHRWPQPEGGDHCALMNDFQELSGFIRTRERGAQNAFWTALAGQTGPLELRDHERLCAIALVKRLFPRLEKSALIAAIGWVPGGNPTAIGNWPSTAYMAAIPWLRGFVDNNERQMALRNYQSDVVAAASAAVRGERTTRVASLAALGELASMDGNFFHPAALANAGDTQLTKDESQRPSLLAQLKGLQKDHPAQPYYAALMLDGDRLGKQLRDGDATDISMRLASFSHGVAAIVERHDGATLYAGGDDVLALLPMDTALNAALALRDAYVCAFANDPKFTASTAIVYAHYHLPLRAVMVEAHRQLDAVAKDANGRDSIALAWFKASGKAAEWVATWTNAHGQSMAATLQALASVVAAGGFGGSFFYHLRARYPLLGKDSTSEVPAGVDKLLQAEYMKSRERTPSLADTEQAIQLLLQACARSSRDDDGSYREADTRGLQLDALRLARLLAGKETHS